MRVEGGRSKERAVVVFVASGPAPATPWQKGTGVEMLQDSLVERWESVYREYGLTAEMVNRSEPGDPAVARQMARASSDVAVMWRSMSDSTDLPWWAVAALVAAAQEFEYQAQDWTARVRQDGMATDGRRSGRRGSRGPLAGSPISGGVGDA